MATRLFLFELFRSVCSYSGQLPASLPLGNDPPVIHHRSVLVPLIAAVLVRDGRGPGSERPAAR